MAIIIPDRSALSYLLYHFPCSLYNKKKEGVYKDIDTEKVTGDAYRSKAHIQIIDWADKKILLEKDFLENILRAV